MNAPLYTIEILRLAAAIPHLGRLENVTATVERRSPTCGSRVTVDVTVEEGVVTAFGQEVQACALGQAAAALLGAHVVGRRVEEIAAASADLAAFLSGKRDDPGTWPGMRALAAARPYPARHPSIRLAFEAAAEAAGR